MKDWKTTMAAVLGVFALAATQGAAVLDGDPSTVPNWSIVIGSIPALIGLIFAGDSIKAA